MKDCEQQLLILGDMVDKDVLYDINEIYLNKTLSIQSFSQSSNHDLLCYYNDIFKQFIESSLTTFQFDFHDPICALLEDSNSKRFPFCS